MLAFHSARGCDPHSGRKHVRIPPLTLILGRIVLERVTLPILCQVFLFSLHTSKFSEDGIHFYCIT